MEVKIKTAEEYWEELQIYSNKDAIFLLHTKITNEIKKMIDELIEREKKIQEGWNEDDFSYAIIQSGINRITELKVKLYGT